MDSELCVEVPRRALSKLRLDEDQERAGRSDNTMAATKSSLETTELLEMIILKLPLRSVLRYQRVSQRWRATITTSIKIRQALFLRPTISSPDTATAQRALEEVSLDASCTDILSGGASKTVVNTILGISGSAVGISFLPTSLPFQAMGSWQRMHLTQPPTTSDFLVGNFIALTASEAVGLPNDKFIPLDRPSAFESFSDGSVTHGSFSRLGAIHLGCKGGLTLEMAANAIAQLHEKFEEAEHKGRQLRFCWGNEVHPDWMVSLLTEIAACVEEDVRRLQSGER